MPRGRQTTGAKLQKAGIGDTQTHTSCGEHAESRVRGWAIRD
eukprot:CAMPEP_0177541696 /NCGR_PEP_ID=MMETSP0369-20130122/60352_1 /TAXON_ID=447022 ORGANISM="Scrippsiella hangoei-like, Strain SHHI-4" /NCGR_SAMPLE_ID=MMETSP0369 /ASSEMBLY_ACC=CAM_ASM_000364 /LENGTH=41 /DNA_ID= /DNA_START= /DNA_END= /DNA_ORIENTATION=